MCFECEDRELSFPGLTNCLCLSMIPKYVFVVESEEGSVTTPDDCVCECLPVCMHVFHMSPVRLEARKNMLVPLELEL